MDTLSYVGGLIVGLLLNESGDISPWLARGVIRWSARRVPDAELARDYEEEWTALLSERPGKLLKLIYSLTFIWPARLCPSGCLRDRKPTHRLTRSGLLWIGTDDLYRHRHGNRLPCPSASQRASRERGCGGAEADGAAVRQVEGSRSVQWILSQLAAELTTPGVVASASAQ